jgi:arginase family enzyme
MNQELLGCHWSSGPGGYHVLHVDAHDDSRYVAVHSCVVLRHVDPPAVDPVRRPEQDVQAGGRDLVSVAQSFKF